MVRKMRRINLSERRRYSSVFLADCRRFSIETAHSKGGSGTALSLNLNQAIISHGNKLPTLDGEKDK